MIVRILRIFHRQYSPLPYKIYINKNFAGYIYAGEEFVLETKSSCKVEIEVKIYYHSSNKLKLTPNLNKDDEIFVILDFNFKSSTSIIRNIELFKRDLIKLTQVDKDTYNKRLNRSESSEKVYYIANNAPIIKSVKYVTILFFIILVIASLTYNNNGFIESGDREWLFLWSIVFGIANIMNYSYDNNYSRSKSISLGRMTALTVIMLLFFIMLWEYELLRYILFGMSFIYGLLSFLTYRTFINGKYIKYG